MVAAALSFPLWELSHFMSEYRINQALRPLPIPQNKVTQVV